MTLQDEWDNLLQVRAQQIAADKANAEAEAQRKAATAQTGAEWFRNQFEQLDADYQPAEPLPAADPAATDFNTFFGLK